MTVYKLCALQGQEDEKLARSVFTPASFSLTYELGKETRAPEELLRAGYGITCYIKLLPLLPYLRDETPQTSIVAYECEARGVYAPTKPRLNLTQALTYMNSLGLSFSDLVDLITATVPSLSLADSWPHGTYMCSSLTPTRIVPLEDLQKLAEREATKGGPTE